jgi:hypothetical protein
MRARHLAVAVGLMPLLLSGCGLIISHGPPIGHEQMPAFSCTESTTGPALDLVWAGLNVFGAAAASSDPGSYDNPDEIVAVGLAWGVVSSVSAAVGFRKAKECRAALLLLAQRNGGPAAGGAAAAQFGPVVVQTVVLAPAADTLAAGEQTQLVATARGSSGAEILNRDFAWSSSNDAIASVSNAGLVTAHAPGSVVIAANTSNVVGTARILVTAPR